LLLPRCLAASGKRWFQLSRLLGMGGKSFPAAPTTDSTSVRRAAAPYGPHCRLWQLMGHIAVSGSMFVAKYPSWPAFGGFDGGERCWVLQPSTEGASCFPIRPTIHACRFDRHDGHFCVPRGPSLCIHLCFLGVAGTVGGARAWRYDEHRPVCSTCCKLFSFFSLSRDQRLTRALTGPARKPRPSSFREREAVSPRWHLEGENQRLYLSHSTPERR